MELWRCDLCNCLCGRDDIGRYRYDAERTSYEMNVCDWCYPEDKANCDEIGVVVTEIEMNEPDDRGMD